MAKRRKAQGQITCCKWKAEEGEAIACQKEMWGERKDWVSAKVRFCQSPWKDELMIGDVNVTGSKVQVKNNVVLRF